MITACDQKIKETNTCLYKHKSGCRNESRGRVKAVLHSRDIGDSSANSSEVRLDKALRFRWFRRVSIDGHFRTRNMRLVSKLLHIGHNSCRANPAPSQSGSFDLQALANVGLRAIRRLFYRPQAAFPYALRMLNRPQKMLRTRNVGNLKASL
jgi:hypothetical protein